MKARLILDEAGRVAIPGGSAFLVREHGVWVFHAGQSLTAAATDAMVDQIRRDRDVTNAGSKG